MFTKREGGPQAARNQNDYSLGGVQSPLPPEEEEWEEPPPESSVVGAGSRVVRRVPEGAKPVSSPAWI